MPVNKNYVYELFVQGIAASQSVVNVFHYWIVRSYDGVNPAPQSTVNVLDRFRNNWRTLIIPILPAAYTALNYGLREIVGSRVNPDTNKKELLYDQGNNLLGGAAEDVGQLAGDILPTFNCATVRKVTDRVGRSYRGSTHFGPVREADTNNNTLLPAFQEDVTTAAATNRTFVVTIPDELEFEEVIYSKTKQLRGPQPNAVPAGYATAVRSYACNPNIGTVLRRKRRRLLGE